MSRVKMDLGSDFHRLEASLMKIKLFRLLVNGWLAFVNVSRDFYIARMILLSDHVPSPQRNHHAPS
ncbi:hypothetical protein [Laspinema olomoucense]|uniref:Uncharacterized protein n=1 Tax=Laspinema olomoucense D3b TaxID=2953688 RepID=A0ABT2N8E7_9CYAN|nr:MULTISPECIES: hypothetical protein [unclassified Laspinema]MCT7971009.1 hypothetical protein [Laspinema sp. D3d]MCT7978964.1 hypothetical protein [Laspinema sp. D3b]MCT7991892.1 hypothetical protein [Laspinema sp. D3a]MCT7996040.1 hypothetical protein [Laspinema sp. D3c]